MLGRRTSRELMDLERRIPSLGRRAAFAACLVAFALAFARPAHADDPKRPLPDYDGRPSAPPSPGDVALWVPRVLLFPPYVVSEYVIRRPLGALISTAERNNWATTLVDFFTFDPNHKSGLVPTAFFDFGLQPSVGLYFFWDDALVRGSDLRATVSYFGSDWLSIAATERYRLGKSSFMALNARWVRRPDYAYFGEGPRTLQSNEANYLAMKLDVAPSYELRIAPAVMYRARAGVRTAAFHDRGRGSHPSVDEEVQRGVFAVPPAYDKGYTDLYERMELAIDSRAASPTARTGVRIAGHVEHGTDVRGSPASSWITYGGALGGSVDVWHERVVALSVMADFADPLRGGPIPFTEEVVWGGIEPLSGYLPGRLHGRSAAAATLAYTWPIWVWLEGRMSASVGNVFDAGLGDFDPKLLRLSGGIGLQSTGNADHRLELLVGFGTETFDQGTKVDSFRLVLGGTNGF
jgi:hypothetical protein